MGWYRAAREPNAMHEESSVVRRHPRGHTRRAVRTAAWLIAILIVAGVLRFYGLRETGIFNVDEGRYVLDALSKAREIGLVSDLVDAKIVEERGGVDLLLADALPEMARHLRALPPIFPKPGYSYLTALVMALTGAMVSAPLFLEAGAGVLMVWVLFRIVRLTHNRRSAVLAAGMLAVSGYHLYYSRNAYPQCSSVVLLMIGVWCHASWFRARPARDRSILLLGCGVFAGLSFWVNYQAAGALPCLAVMHLLACLRGGSALARFGRFVKGGLLIGAGFFAVVVFAEALSYPMIFLYRTQGMHYPHATFLELLWPRVVARTSDNFEPSGLALFPFYFDLLEGHVRAVTAAGLLALGGWVTVARVRNNRDATLPEAYRVIIYLIVPFLVPFLIFSTKTLQGARTFTYALPFFVALAAIVAETAWRCPPMRPRWALRVGLAIVLLIAGGMGSFPIVEILSIRSGYAELMDYIKQEDEAGVCAAWSSTLLAYTIENDVEGGSIYTYRTQGVEPPRFYVTDWQEFYNDHYPDESPHTPEGARLVHTIDHGVGRIFLQIEASPNYPNALDNLRWKRALDLDRARKLLVYDLRPGE
ncbi:MAG: hypothetical protein GY851_26955 [bacterium]|nr:hypothetical protein [bacterium]